MDRVSAQPKLDRGYGKIARKLGRPYAQYRASTAFNPISDQNKVGDLNCLFDPKSEFSVQRVALYGKPIWFAAVDRTTVEVGDYFVGGNGTWFIASMQDIAPTMAVKCNAVASIYRPGSGQHDPYYPAPEGTQTDTLTGWPVSFLEGTKGERSVLNGPLDTRVPWFDVLMPVFNTGDVRTHDRLRLDDGTEWVISSPELTELGWRMTCGLVTP